MDSHDVENYFRQHRKTLAVVFLMIGMLSVSGFFMGLVQTEKQEVQRFPVQHSAVTAAHAANLPTAPKYGEIAVSDWLANRDWKFTLANLPRANAPADSTEATESERQAAIAHRASLRAYDGAPPVIPHGIDTLSSAACISCHGRDGNLVISGKRPAEISHPWVTNCTSCHVPADGLRQITASKTTRLNIENTFLGKRSAGSGPRAYDGAPPTTPHPVWMRQNCMACHGPGREQAIRTSHPERENCLQCHAPNAIFDNRESYPTNPKPPVVK
ncbi:MAG: nitrate reductase cytochrome c-type subunit [Luteolibacter sp.]